MDITIECSEVKVSGDCDMGSVFVDCKGVLPSKTEATSFLRIALERLGWDDTMAMLCILKATGKDKETT